MTLQELLNQFNPCSFMIIMNYGDSVIENDTCEMEDEEVISYFIYEDNSIDIIM